jgi:hypothetical protein
MPIAAKGKKQPPVKEPPRKKHAPVKEPGPKPPPAKAKRQMR